MDVTISVEKGRGCGYRKPGKNGVGIYLVGPSPGSPCGRLPFVLDVCPCCSQGIKQSRGWTWIEPRLLFGEPPVDDIVPARPECAERLGSSLMRRNGLDLVQLTCSTCPVGGGTPTGKHGLIWVGEKFYDSPQSFLGEAAQMGISRKLAALPRGFKLGETWVYLAHRKAVQKINPPQPGIFSVFKPTGVDLVIDDENEVPERATKLAESLGDGVRIVKVVRDTATQTSLLDHLDAPQGTRMPKSGGSEYGEPE